MAYETPGMSFSRGLMSSYMQMSQLKWQKELALRREDRYERQLAATKDMNARSLAVQEKVAEARIAGYSRMGRGGVFNPPAYSTIDRTTDALYDAVSSLQTSKGQGGREWITPTQFSKAVAQARGAVGYDKMPPETQQMIDAEWALEAKKGFEFPTGTYGPDKKEIYRRVGFEKNFSPFQNMDDYMDRAIKYNDDDVPGTTFAPRSEAKAPETKTAFSQEEDIDFGEMTEDELMDYIKKGTTGSGVTSYSTDDALLGGGM